MPPSGSLLGRLSAAESQIEERLRTLSLCICAGGVLCYALYVLRGILVPLILAVALTYLLQPMIDILSRRPLPCCCGVTLCQRPPEQLRTAGAKTRPLLECLLQAKLPRWLAVCVALMVAFAVLGLLGFVVADSIHVFSKRAGVYSERVTQLCMGVLEAIDRARAEWAESFGGAWLGANATSAAVAVQVNDTAEEESARERMNQLAALAGKLPVTALIMHSLSSMMEALSNLALVLLFAVYLLFGSPRAPSPPSAKAHNSVGAQADAQIMLYIRGKVAMSALVGLATALSLGALRVDLWQAFGLLAFWLNFIPNVGTVLAVALPMPLVVLDPSFSLLGVALALLLPLAAHGFAGNVLEPILFGHTLKLHPVTVLLSLLLWGTVWGATGMVLAVPITAVLRIRLSHIPHVNPRALEPGEPGELASLAWCSPGQRSSPRFSRLVLTRSALEPSPGRLDSRSHNGSQGFSSATSTPTPPTTTTTRPSTPLPTPTTASAAPSSWPTGGGGRRPHSTWSRISQRPCRRRQPPMRSMAAAPAPPQTARARGTPPMRSTRRRRSRGPPSALHASIRSLRLRVGRASSCCSAHNTARRTAVSRRGRRRRCRHLGILAMLRCRRQSAAACSWAPSAARRPSWPSRAAPCLSHTTTMRSESPHISGSQSNQRLSRALHTALKESCSTSGSGRPQERRAPPPPPPPKRRCAPE